MCPSHTKKIMHNYFCYFGTNKLHVLIYVVYTHSLEGHVTTCITFVVRACNNLGIRKVMLVIIYNQYSFVIFFMRPVHGRWSDFGAWTSWSTCDKSCGTGTRTRTMTRFCNNPAPRHGGYPCAGPATQTESEPCKVRECPSTYIV